MRFTLTDYLLNNVGLVKVECIAEIPEVYKGMVKVFLSTGRLIPASAYEAKATLISHPGEKKNQTKLIR